MTLRSQRSIYGHCLGHGSGSCMFKAAREICTISYEVNECMKHMLLNDILQLVVLLDNYTTVHRMLNRRMDAKHLDLSHPNQLGATAPRRFGATNLLFLVHSP